ncbi:MAG: hypothetical protein JWM98_1666, partial [Thermoleophilia bacterium]|nr:hypothetical protein [Thermoleophilia bacterium]
MEHDPRVARPCIGYLGLRAAHLGARSTRWYTGGVDGLSTTGRRVLELVDGHPDDILVPVLVVRAAGDIGVGELAAALSELAAANLVIVEHGVARLAPHARAHPWFDAAPLTARRASALQLAAAWASSAPDGPAARHARAACLAAAGDLDGAVDALRDAAQRAVGCDDLEAAARSIDMALELERRPDGRIPLLRERAALGARSDDPRTTDWWRDLARIASAKHDDEALARAMVGLYWASRDGAAINRLHHAVALDVETVGWAARAAATLALLGGAWREAIAHDRTALRIAREQGDRELEQTALEKLSVALSYSGCLDEAAATMREAIALQVDAGCHLDAARARLSLSDLLMDDLQPAEALAETRAAVLEAGARADVAALARSYGASASIALGRIDDAVAACEQACEALDGRDDDVYRAAALCQAAHAYVERGALVHARRMLDRARASVEASGFASLAFEVHFDELRLAALGPADRRADGLVELARAIVIDEPGSMARLALWCARASVLHEEPALLDVALGHVDAIAGQPGRLVRFAVDEVRALAMSAPNDQSVLDLVAQQWQALGRPLDAARVAAVAAWRCSAHASDAGAVGRLRDAEAALCAAGARSDADQL